MNNHTSPDDWAADVLARAARDEFSASEVSFLRHLGLFALAGQLSHARDGERALLPVDIDRFVDHAYVSALVLAEFTDFLTSEDLAWVMQFHRQLMVSGLEARGMRAGNFGDDPSASIGVTPEQLEQELADLAGASVEVLLNNLPEEPEE